MNVDVGRLSRLAWEKRKGKNYEEQYSTSSNYSGLWSIPEQYFSPSKAVAWQQLTNHSTEIAQKRKIHCHSAVCPTTADFTIESRDVKESCA
jgi:hypothetical protein